MTEKIISQGEVKKVAKLARIELSAEEGEKFSQELDSILGFFKDISEVETMGQEKFDHYDLHRNRFRPDQIGNAAEGQKEGIRSQFPDRKDGYLKVKEVLKNGKGGRKELGIRN